MSSRLVKIVDSVSWLTLYLILTADQVISRFHKPRPTQISGEAIKSE